MLQDTKSAYKNSLHSYILTRKFQKNKWGFGGTVSFAIAKRIKFLEINLKDVKGLYTEKNAKGLLDTHNAVTAFLVYSSLPAYVFLDCFLADSLCPMSQLGISPISSLAVSSVLCGQCTVQNHPLGFFPHCLKNGLLLLVLSSQGLGVPSHGEQYRLKLQMGWRTGDS